MSHWLFTEEHEEFRKTVRRFMEAEIKPYVEQWEKEGTVPRSALQKLGEQGYIGVSFPKEYGGSGLDVLFSTVVGQEITRCGSGGVGASLSASAGIALSKILLFGNEKQKKKYIPDGLKGKKIFALGVTEPNTGSDVASIQTRADRDGDYYILNGSKTFITNGVNTDYAIIAAKTREEPRHRNVSLFIVDTSSEGYSVGKNLQKLGWRSSNTGELFFDDVKVPVENLIGEENAGFKYIMQDFQYERISMALSSVTLAEIALEDAIAYSKEREQFGRSINNFQVLRHMFVDMAVDIEKARNITYRALYLYYKGENVINYATMAKAYAAEMVQRVTDQALQVFGGNGYMMDYPVQRYWRDARLQSIGGGTTQIMNEILKRTLNIEVQVKES